MYTAEVRIGLADPSSTTRGGIADELYGLLGCWNKNGQILAPWLMAERSDSFLLYVSLPETDSLRDDLSNIYVRRSLEKLRQHGAAVAEIKILGPEPDSSLPCECQSSTDLILFTTFLSRGSPLRCADCFQSVPLYRVPHMQNEDCDVLMWAADYQSCDTLQMQCTTGERFGERQLYRHDSSLSRHGIKICGQYRRDYRTQDVLLPNVDYLPVNGSFSSMARKRLAGSLSGHIRLNCVSA